MEDSENIPSFFESDFNSADFPQRDNNVDLAASVHSSDSVMSNFSGFRNNYRANNVARIVNLVFRLISDTLKALVLIVPLVYISRLEVHEEESIREQEFCTKVLLAYSLFMTGCVVFAIGSRFRVARFIRGCCTFVFWNGFFFTWFLVIYWAV